MLLHVVFWGSCKFKSPAQSAMSVNVAPVKSVATAASRLFSGIPHVFGHDSQCPVCPVLHLQLTVILLLIVFMVWSASDIRAPQVEHFLKSSMSFDSFTIHFLSFHPLGCLELLDVLPVLEVEELVNGAKLLSAAGSEHMLMSKADVELMSITDDVCASCY